MVKNLKTVEKIKAELLEKKKYIEKEISEKEVLVNEHQETTFADANDLATHDVDMTNDLNVKMKKIATLKDIENALKMIEDGSYGICQECGIDISLKRLEAYPTSSHCITCREELERKEKMKTMTSSSGSIE